MFDRATRLCRMSPQMTTVSPSIRPRRRRIVRASSRAWVGCSWLPSPALITAAVTFSDKSLTAPDSGWRTTSTSGCMAFRVIAVSIRVSPFLIELGADRHVDGVGAQALAGQLERRPGPGRVLEEQVDDGAAAQPGGFLLRLAVDVDIAFRGIQQ